MKRKITLLLTAVLMLVSGLTWGQTREEVVAYTLDGTITGGSAGYAEESEITQNGLTWKVMGNTTMNPWRIGGKNLSGVDRPLYSTGTISDNITKIVVEHGTASSITVNSMTLVVSANADFSNPTSTLSGSVTANDSETFTRPTGADWSNKYYKITYNVSVSGNTNRFVQFKSATFYKENTGTTTQACATPTFSPTGGTTCFEPTDVTISCTTDGATIYYTLDGNDPTTSSAVYSAPITITATTTIKAMAAKTGLENSSVATATYTVPNFITIAEARALALNEYAWVQGIVVFVDGKNVYIQDETGGIVLYLNANASSAVTLGKLIQAYGKRANYNGLAELSGIDGSNGHVFSVSSDTYPLPLAEKTIAEIWEDAQSGANTLQSTRLQIVNATLGTIVNSGNSELIQEEDTINIYKLPALGSNFTTGTAVDVIGVVGYYNNPQLRVASADDVTLHEQQQVETVATPTFSPEAGSYTAVQTVTIACTTDGATIYYTLDGNDPISVTGGPQGSVYSAPISISETTTVKAVAVKQGMNDSGIASAEYIIQIPQDLVFHKLFNHTAVNDNDTYMIVDVTGGYALTSANGTSSAPAAVAVTIEGDSIHGDIADALQWKFESVDGGYRITPITDSTIHLYTTNTNNGVRVGTNENNVWELNITDANKPNYHGFKNVAFNRYLGVYSNSNWRTYTSIGTNIENTKIEIFVLGEAPAPTYYTVSVAPGIANGTVTVDTTLAMAGETITVTATPNLGYELTSLTYTYPGVAVPIDIMATKQFTMPSADVTVNAAFTELAHVANPTFTPAAGSYITAQLVSIACVTDSATIYYTTDGSTPTTQSAVYTEPFTVSSTTTVKAMAVKEGMNNSEVSSAEYNIIETMTIADARALDNNAYALVQGVVTFIDGRNIYVQDATAGIDLYLNNNTVPESLALGDMVLAYGKKTVYNGLVELTSIAGNNANQFVILSNGNELPIVVKTIAEILADNTSGANTLQSTRVQIVNATIGTINTANNTPITQDENTLNIYKMPVVEGLEEGDFVTVTGIIGCYNAPQLRVSSASDVEFTHPAGITITPTSLSGFNYVYEEGPSNVKTFVISARSLSGSTTITPPDSYEISSFPGEAFYPESQIVINTYTGMYNYTIKVRLKAGLEIGTYEESITIDQPELDTMYVALSGSVTGQPQPSADYVRIADLSQLTDGSKVIIAARFDENVNDYYAMTAQASGKPTGVLFTSVAGAANETLPSEITDEEDTYYWTVTTDGANYTFTNANGDVLGYTSSTNFATGGDNTAWAITYQTSEEGAMVPNYSGFVINNVNNAVRAIALNGNHNFGPYHTQNMGSETYNFFLDLFVTASSGTLTCATPTFTPEGGTYFEEQEVAIACGTADATIYYTTDGSDPDENSEVYSEPITVAESMTIKAIAMKEGYENSAIATAEYTVILGAVTIFEQDWEGEMNGWTFVTVEGSKPWTIGQYSGNHYAYGNGYNGGANEQWCISPAFNLNVYSNVSLTFSNAKNYTGPDMEVYFSNDYDGENPSEATWTELEYEMSTGSFTWVESGAIDLAGFTGDECYIGFKYTSTETEAAAWEVDDIILMGFTTEPYLTVTPNALSGFNYIVGNGPSAVQTFTVSGGNLPPAPGGTTGGITITCSNTHYEFSLDGEEFWPYTISIQATGTLEPTTVYVRLEAGLYVGQWDGVVTFEDGGLEVTATVSGTVIEEPVPGGDWNRIYALSDLHDGDQVILASRYDATVGDGYYAMTAGVSGKPDGVLFTSVNENGIEKLPDEISADAATYLWNVTVNDTVITLTNAAGDALGYSSSTNFAGNENIEWNITMGTAGENAMVPGYTGFVITNGTTTNRGIAKNASNKFGAYAVSNMNNADYNFFLDLFVLGGTATQTVATPVFSVASGTYYEAFDVEITCATEGATIYYTTDGSDPTAESNVYEGAITVDGDITLKAIAMMEGYENSGIATVNYTVITGVTIILNQDWEGEMNGWTFVTVEGNKPWTIGEYNGNHYANANGYNDDTDNDQWCISPAIDLSYYRDVVLTFRNAMKFTGPDMELLISTNYDGQDPTAATWTELEYEKSQGNYTWVESGEISLDGFRGNDCHIAFHYISSIDEGAAAWEVDDILVVGTDYDAVDETEVFDVNFWNYDNEIFVENQSNGNVQMSVFNLMGQQVFAKTICAGTVRFSHNLANGLYVVTLRNGKGRMSVKMIVR